MGFASLILLLIETSMRILRTETLMQFMSGMHTLHAIAAIYTSAKTNTSKSEAKDFIPELITFVTEGVLPHLFIIIFQAPYFLALARVYCDFESERRR